MFGRYLFLHCRIQFIPFHRSKMFPLLFIPGDTASSKDTDIAPVSYDLKCSEEFGCGAMSVSISVLDKRNVGEPVYSVTVNTVKVVCAAVPIIHHVEYADFPIIHNAEFAAVLII